MCYNYGKLKVERKNGGGPSGIGEWTPICAYITKSPTNGGNKTKRNAEEEPREKEVQAQNKNQVNMKIDGMNDNLSTKEQIMRILLK